MDHRWDFVEKLEEDSSPWSSEFDFAAFVWTLDSSSFSAPEVARTVCSFYFYCPVCYPFAEYLEWRERRAWSFVPVELRWDEEPEETPELVACVGHSTGACASRDCACSEKFAVTPAASSAVVSCCEAAVEHRSVVDSTTSPAELREYVCQASEWPSPNSAPAEKKEKSL